jgi:hypothetical protein
MINFNFPSYYQVEAAAKTLLEWQFPMSGGWDSAPEGLRAKFREGAKLILERTFEGDNN